MSETISARVAELGHALPDPSTPAANYVPWVRSGNLVFISGQVPLKDGQCAYVGRVGEELDVETGRKAAQLCALNVLAHLAAAVEDDLSRVVRCVRLGGFVNAAPGFGQQPVVVNGASDLMVEVFGDKGKHSRAAVGVSSLPRNAAVEVDAVFEVL
ncbi:MAG TPA: RidA family protein [Burkholderiaceae bacterium]|nr:RidA family protein [Burkholderiaceae bacterium]